MKKKKKKVVFLQEKKINDYLCTLEINNM